MTRDYRPAMDGLYYDVNMNNRMLSSTFINRVERTDRIDFIIDYLLHNVENYYFRRVDQIRQILNNEESRSSFLDNTNVNIHRLNQESRLSIPIKSVQYFNEMMEFYNRNPVIGNKFNSLFLNEDGSRKGITMNDLTNQKFITGFSNILTTLLYNVSKNNKLKDLFRNAAFGYSFGESNSNIRLLSSVPFLLQNTEAPLTNIANIGLISSTDSSNSDFNSFTSFRRIIGAAKSFLIILPVNVDYLLTMIRSPLLGSRIGNNMGGFIRRSGKASIYKIVDDINIFEKFNEVYGTNFNFKLLYDGFLKDLQITSSVNDNKLEEHCLSYAIKQHRHIDENKRQILLDLITPNLVGCDKVYNFNFSKVFNFENIQNALVLNKIRVVLHYKRKRDDSELMTKTTYGCGQVDADEFSFFICDNHIMIYKEIGFSTTFMKYLHSNPEELKMFLYKQISLNFLTQDEIIIIKQNNSGKTPINEIEKVLKEKLIYENIKNITTDDIDKYFPDFYKLFDKTIVVNKNKNDKLYICYKENRRIKINTYLLYKSCISFGFLQHWNIIEYNKLLNENQKKIIEKTLMYKKCHLLSLNEDQVKFDKGKKENKEVDANKNIIGYFDFETIPEDEGHLPFLVNFQYIIDGMDYKVSYYGYKCAGNFYDKLELLVKQNKRNIIVYAHNLMYDSRFLRSFDLDGYVEKNGRCYSQTHVVEGEENGQKYKYSIVFKDFLALTNTALKNLPKWFPHDAEMQNTKKEIMIYESSKCFKDIYMTEIQQPIYKLKDKGNSIDFFNLLYEITKADKVSFQYKQDFLSAILDEYTVYYNNKKVGNYQDCLSVIKQGTFLDLLLQSWVNLGDHYIRLINSLKYLEEIKDYNFFEKLLELKKEILNCKLESIYECEKLYNKYIDFIQQDFMFLYESFIGDCFYEDDSINKDVITNYSIKILIFWQSYFGNEHKIYCSGDASVIQEINERFAYIFSSNFQLEFSNLIPQFGHLYLMILTNFNNCKIRLLDYYTFYCEQDVKILKLAHKNFKTLCEGDPINLNIDEFLTSPSLAKKWFSEKIYKNKNMFSICGPTQKFILETCHGGKCMTARNRKIKIEDGKILNLDCTSLYPSAMSKIYTISGKATHINRYIENLNDIEFNIHNLCDCEFFMNYLYTAKKNSLFTQNYLIEFDLGKYESILKYEVFGFGFLIDITNVNVFRDFPCIVRKTDKGKHYSNGTGECYITDVQLMDMINYHDITFKILDGYVYSNKFDKDECCSIHYDIRNNILELFNLRKEYKKAKNPAEICVKLLLNSGYGNMMQKPIDSYIKIIHSDEELNKTLSTLNENWTSLEKVYNSNGIPTDTYIIKGKKSTYLSSNLGHLASQVLAYSKHIMHRVMYLAENLGIEIYYTDTDSIHMNGEKFDKLCEEYKKLYNDELTGSTLCHFHNDFDGYECKIYNKHTDLTGVDPITDLYAVSGIYIGKKMYCEKVYSEALDTYGYNFRLKGIPQDVILNEVKRMNLENVYELYELLYKGEEIEFDLMSTKVRFKIGIDNIVNLDKFTRKIKSYYKPIMFPLTMGLSKIDLLNVVNEWKYDGETCYEIVKGNSMDVSNEPIIREKYVNIKEGMIHDEILATLDGKKDYKTDGDGNYVEESTIDFDTGTLYNSKFHKKQSFSEVYQFYKFCYDMYTDDNFSPDFVKSNQNIVNGYSNLFKSFYMRFNICSEYDIIKFVIEEYYESKEYLKTILPIRESYYELTENIYVEEEDPNDYKYPHNNTPNSDCEEEETVNNEEESEYEEYYDFINYDDKIMGQCVNEQCLINIRKEIEDAVEEYMKKEQKKKLQIEEINKCLRQKLNVESESSETESSDTIEEKIEDDKRKFVFDYEPPKEEEEDNEEVVLECNIKINEKKIDELLKSKCESD